VGRTSVEAVGEAVEAVSKDLAALGKIVVGEAAVTRVDVKERARAAWTWQRPVRR
jgi:hypothetical protein